MLAILTAETLSPFSRPPDLENALEIYDRLQNLPSLAQHSAA